MALKNLIKNHFIDFVSICFICVFTYGGFIKLFDFENFVSQLGKSPLLYPMASFVALTVPLLEILIAVLLIFNTTKISGLYISFFLMSLFTTYIVAILYQAEYIPCSCGGILEKMSWGEHLIFNSVLLALAAIALLFSRNVNKKGEAENLQE